MKIGILTFHSQLNYGGVLQAVASYTYLKKQGYDAVLVDRWLSANNHLLLEPFTKPINFKQWFHIILGFTYGRGDVLFWLRIVRTIRFLKKNIIRTPYHFTQWEELKDNPLGFDLLYVGSDQVWNCSWGSPAVYLLEGLTQDVPPVSYAASVGMREIPENYRPLYKCGLARFKALAVREKSAKKLIENLLTAKNNVIVSEAKQSQSSNKPIMHVVDPVLLLERSDWERIADTKAHEGDFIFCYILRESLVDVLPKIIAFSNRYKVKVKVYGHGPYLPFSLKRPHKFFFKNWALNLKLLFSRVSVCLSSGPKEFVRDIATAKGVVTDSFHATMFSAIFDKDVRVVRPQNKDSSEMFSRMDEFAQNYTKGEIFADNLDAAFKSLVIKPRTLRYRDEQLGSFRQASRAWLANNLPPP